MPSHRKVTGFSGNEIFCLEKLGYRPGQLCVGNNVLALGIGRGLKAGLKSLAGGEIGEITKIIHDGRNNAYSRLIKEAKQQGCTGLAGITFDIIRHGSNTEFLAVGSTVHKAPADAGAEPQAAEKFSFSSFSNAQELYCQMDSGFTPRSFVFGNVAYSIGMGGSIKGGLRSLARGEVGSFTEIFDRTRHLALTRLKDKAKKTGANAVLGIQTSIVPMMGAQEMLMTGTAASHPALAAYADDPVTSDMTNEEMWNMVNHGYMPLGLVMGVSVYALGVLSGLKSFGKGISGGQVETLTELLYEAREKAFDRIEQQAETMGADEVVGVKLRIYDMGGMIEVMAIGTAVKKMPDIATKSESLIVQAVIKDTETFVEANNAAGNTDIAALAARKGSSAQVQAGPIKIFGFVFILIMYALAKFMGHN